MKCFFSIFFTKKVVKHVSFHTGTSGMENHRKFLEWANDQKEPVFISEYLVNDSRFKCIANFKKRSLLSSNKDNKLVKTEKVYANRAGYLKLMSRK